MRVSGGNKDDRIFLRADRAVHYGDVMQVMNDLRSAGYLKIALVGAGNAGCEMTAHALTWFEDDDPRDLFRWAVAAAVVVCVHVALIGGYLFWHPAVGRRPRR